jgi:two-component system cell cycle sensor histidine kinase PleC
MQQIELLQNISEFVHNLQKLTTNTLQLTHLKINDLLQDCALIHSHTAFLQGKKIVCKLQDNLPLFCADELRFKQIILGLISLSLKCTKQGSLIVISSALHIDGDKQYLAIGIKDDGIGLSTKELQRLRDKLQLKSFDSQLDGTGLDIEEIIKLVELHEGTYSEKSKIGEGKEIILTFPLSTEKELITNKMYSEKREDNVYMFTKKNIQE